MYLQNQDLQASGLAVSKSNLDASAVHQIHKKLFLVLSIKLFFYQG